MKKSIVVRFLDAVERVGSKLPDPITLFIIAAALVVLASWVTAGAGVTVTHPGTGETVGVENLLSTKWIRQMFTEAVNNFTQFPPLGLVLVTMIGIAVAERGGFITAMLRRTVHVVPKSMLTGALVFAGVESSLVADAGYVVLIPLGAVIFAAVGRHPLAGLSATFAGVAGGFSANLSVTSLDPLLGGLTQAAAQLIDPAYTVSAAANWWFMIASTFYLTIMGTVICEKLVEPRLGPWKFEEVGEDAMQQKLTPLERKGLLWAGITFVIGLIGVALISIPEGAVLRDEAGTLKPLEHSIVLILMLLFLFAGMVYAFVTKSAKNDKDIALMASDGMATMGGYIVLSFVMAQFIFYFKWSNLGIVTAVNGAEFLKSLQLEGPFLLTAFILVAAGINLLVASASAKWAIMAPVFVPMFMLLGVTPEATQLAYRIGDSSTNMIAPLMGYLPLIIVAMQRYKKDASLGTMVSLMLPYSIAMILTWTVLMLGWLWIGLDIGPGVSAAMP